MKLEPRRESIRALVAVDAGFLILEDMQEAARRVADLLWADSGLAPADIDVASLYDGFSPMIVQWLEGLGFAEIGEGFAFVQDGRTRRDGALPLNTGGGNLGVGRMHGVPQLMEAVRQVTGRAGDAQVAGAELSLAAIGPASVGSAVIFGSQPPSRARRASRQAAPTLHRRWIEA